MCIVVSRHSIQLYLFFKLQHNLNMKKILLNFNMVLLLIIIIILFIAIANTTYIRKTHRI